MTQWNSLHCHVLVTAHICKSFLKLFVANIISLLSRVEACVWFNYCEQQHNCRFSMCSTDTWFNRYCSLTTFQIMSSQFNNSNTWHLISGIGIIQIIVLNLNTVGEKLWLLPYQNVRATCKTFTTTCRLRFHIKFGQPIVSLQRNCFHNNLCSLKFCELTECVIYPLFITSNSHGLYI